MHGGTGARAGCGAERGPAGPPPDSSSTWTIRGIRKLAFDDHSSGSLRIDVPLVLTTAPERGHVDGEFQGGFGNLLNQVGLIYSLNDRWASPPGHR